MRSDRETEKTKQHMSGVQSLSHPHGRRPGVVGQHVEDPGLPLVDDGERLAALALAGVASGPVRRVEAQLHGEVAHELHGLSGRGASLQRQSRQLVGLDAGQAAGGGGGGPEARRARALADRHLVLVHDAVAGFEQCVRMFDLQSAVKRAVMINDSELVACDLRNITDNWRLLPPCMNLFLCSFKIVWMPSCSSIVANCRRVFTPVSAMMQVMIVKSKAQF